MKDFPYTTNHQKEEFASYMILEKTFYILKLWQMTYMVMNSVKTAWLFFSTIFKFYEPSIDLKKLQPQNRQCTEPIELNAKLLAKYGDKVLKAEEWIFWDINLHQPARAQLLR